jgi:DNA/RNA-binding domain of Phe-tRNA-synthetase-like protein
MALESHYTVIDPLYENILGSKLLRDDDASPMLDIVFDTVLYDIGLIWNFKDMSTSLLTNKDTNVASLLAGISGAVETEIQKLQKTVEEME